ncbi:MAG: hypothetical protein IJX85_12410 [Lachnospiraceae bacterium]|nr:hypothetical protein [Lachnospiraceae bacterium]
MEINSAKALMEHSRQNMEEKIKDEVMKNIESAMEDGNVSAFCCEPYPSLQQELLDKGYDIVRFYDVSGRENCNLIYWGKNASGKLMNFVE